jgi:uncharacterized protein YndB with AHSA1/START domain
METREKIQITVETTINETVEKVWDFWTNPEHITKWYQASDDWHAPFAENDLRINGKFKTKMAAKDRSAEFDFEGVYTNVILHKLIEYTLPDCRKVSISFSGANGKTLVKEIFETENLNTHELQKGGWQAILDNFKKHVEASGKLERLHFETSIKAGIEKVYKTLIDEKHYSEWTAEFNPTSYFKGSWEKGSKILFLGTDKNGNTGGMTSRIKENIPNKFISIEHLGIVQGDKEITSGEEVEKWAGGLENYTFVQDQQKTLLSVDVDANSEFRSYFMETFPKALNKLKSICEK